MKEEIDNAVKYTGRGRNARFEGVFPQKYIGIFSPSKDAISYAGNKRVLDLEDFCLPDIYVFYPEAQYGDMYKNSAPPCKWCGTSECVKRDGWMTLPRRGHTRTRNVAILSRRYYCSEREKNGIKPFNFRGIDEEVIAKSPDYVAMRWRMDGFDLSHQSAISLSLLRDARAAVVQFLQMECQRQHSGWHGFMVGSGPMVRLFVMWNGSILLPTLPIFKAETRMRQITFRILDGLLLLKHGINGLIVWAPHTQMLRIKVRLTSKMHTNLCKGEHCNLQLFDLTNNSWIT